MTPVRILLIEDNTEDATLIQEALVAEQGNTFTLTHVRRLSEGLRHLAHHEADVVLLDLRLPDSEGVGTIARVRQQAPEVPVLVLTGSDDTGIAVDAVKQGAEDYLVKGYVQVYPTLLSRAIRYALERQRAEEQVRRAHAQTEQLLFSIPSILIRVSPDGRITHWNAVAEATFGVTTADIIGQPLEGSAIGWHFEKVREAIARCRSTNQAVVLEDMPVWRADGPAGFVGLTIVPMRGDGEDDGHGVLIFGADVTERKRAEAERERLQAQLLQSQKMETIGRFAGGIAHDFNNFLQVILGFAWLIRARFQKSPELMTDLQEIVHAAESASEMIHQLLAFSRRKPLQPKVLDMNAAVRSMARLLQQFAGESIRVDVELHSEPLAVKCDPTGLEQVLMNLCANARDSMPQGGTLTVSTRRVEADAAFRDIHPAAKASAYAALSIRDTGTGMEPTVAAHVFEPFFTTKQTGKGTGLGLAVVYGLVQQHEGLVHIETAPGQGTTFHLFFPYRQLEPAELAALQAAGDTPPPAAEPAAAVPPAAAGTGRTAKPRILVVDDDPAIRRLCERILAPTCEVLVLPSGRAALDELGRTRYHLLLTDLRMPNMDGVTLLKEVAKLAHAPHVLAMTGSVTREMEQRLQTVPLSGPVIHKPFTAPTLLDEVGRCLGQTLQAG
jgi:PAS domain S-box-containing protein